MKTTLFSAGFLVCCLFTVSAQEIAISPKSLPGSVTKFVTKHFPGTSIVSATKETKRHKTEYEVNLQDGTQLEFDNSTITEIKNGKRLPNSVLPAKLLQYVQKTHPQNWVVEWSRDSKKQELKLDDGRELEFNLRGDFLRVDD